MTECCISCEKEVGRVAIVPHIKDVIIWSFWGCLKFKLRFTDYEVNIYPFRGCWPLPLPPIHNTHISNPTVSLFSPRPFSQYLTHGSQSQSYCFTSQIVQKQNKIWMVRGQFSMYNGIINTSEIFVRAEQLSSEPSKINNVIECFINWSGATHDASDKQTKPLHFATFCCFHSQHQGRTDVQRMLLNMLPNKINKTRT